MGEQIVIQNGHFDLLTSDTKEALKNLDLGSVKNNFLFSTLMETLTKKSEIYNTERNRIVLKYSKKDDKGEPITNKENQTVKINNIQDFNKDMSELMNIEVSIDLSKIEIDLDKLDDKNVKSKVKATDFILPLVTVKIAKTEVEKPKK